jgi:hypothetical protein
LRKDSCLDTEARRVQRAAFDVPPFAQSLSSLSPKPSVRETRLTLCPLNADSRLPISITCYQLLDLISV